MRKRGAFFQDIIFMGGPTIQGKFLGGLFYMGGLMVRTYQELSQNAFYINLNTINLKTFHNHGEIFT